MKGNEIKFWVLFFTLNCILFLPAYFVNIDNSTFFPIKSFTQGTWYMIFKSVFKRSNYDIFRLSIDFTIWVSVFYFLRHKFKIVPFSIVITLYYLVILIFLIYYEVMFKLFLVEPVLYNDIYLLKLGYYNIGNHSIFLTIGALLIMVLVYYIFFKLFKNLLKTIQSIVFGKISLIVIFLIGFLMLINVLRSGLTFKENHVFHLSIARVIDNLERSSEAAKNISKINVEVLNNKASINKSYLLGSFPDVYLLFLESYGKIVYQDSGFNKLYLECISECEKMLIKSGWNIASDFSLSPVSGGKSWISFTSVMFGFNIHNQGTYLYLLRNTETQKYTNIFKYFQSNGYKSYWINPLPDNPDMKIPWDLYTKFYSVDRWITDKDIDYHGKLYGFGPSPPDEYSLFKAEQIMEQDSKKPHIVFYITHNSHNPFFSPDSVVENWQTLNVGNFGPNPPSVFIKKPKASDYIKSITYELQAITRFIIESKNKNAIYVLIGDHQPPVLTTQRNGFETPVHIIATDSTLINSFHQYGFSKGLYISDSAQRINHEAIYSMLLREIIRKYGIQKNQLPEYFPTGINTN